ncbi:MAG TPA: hypothetical protein PL110_02355 [Candidatus Eremiobacteraeota bacterium]|nr:hypothetical protein [Candidatus Eremiobacteraeota bacterium]
MFLKISQVIQAEFNQMLQKAEEPEELLEEIIADLEKQAKELREITVTNKNIPGEKLGRIEQKLEAAYRRRDFYSARKRRMEAQKNIQETMSQIEDISRYERIVHSEEDTDFERM